jgi:two-component system, sensor histidine kinase
MDKSTVSGLFQNGTSAPTGGTSGEKSTGLGLAIVKYFVDLHNGSIDVSSKPDEGTEFSITIPLTEDCK